MSPTRCEKHSDVSQVHNAQEAIRQCRFTDSYLLDELQSTHQCQRNFLGSWWFLPPEKWRQMNLQPVLTPISGYLLKGIFNPHLGTLSLSSRFPNGKNLNTDSWLVHKILEKIELQCYSPPISVSPSPDWIFLLHPSLMAPTWYNQIFNQIDVHTIAWTSPTITFFCDGEDRSSSLSSGEISVCNGYKTSQQDSYFNAALKSKFLWTRSDIAFQSSYSEKSKKCLQEKETLRIPKYGPHVKTELHHRQYPLQLLRKKLSTQSIKKALKKLFLFGSRQMNGTCGSLNTSRAEVLSRPSRGRSGYCLKRRSLIRNASSGFGSLFPYMPRFESKDPLFMELINLEMGLISKRGYGGINISRFLEERQYSAIPNVDVMMPPLDDFKTTAVSLMNHSLPQLIISGKNEFDSKDSTPTVSSDIWLHIILDGGTFRSLTITPILALRGLICYDDHILESCRRDLMVDVIESNKVGWISRCIHSGSFGISLLGGEISHLRGLLRNDQDLLRYCRRDINEAHISIRCKSIKISKPLHDWVPDTQTFRCGQRITPHVTEKRQMFYYFIGAIAFSIYFHWTTSFLNRVLANMAECTAYRGMPPHEATVVSYCLTESTQSLLRTREMIDLSSYLMLRQPSILPRYTIKLLDLETELHYAKGIDSNELDSINMFSSFDSSIQGQVTGSNYHDDKLCKQASEWFAAESLEMWWLALEAAVNDNTGEKASKSTLFVNIHVLLAIMSSGVLHIV